MDIEEKFEQACRDLEYNHRDEAKRAFEEILEENPEYCPALNKLGVIYIKEERIGDAREYFEKALLINPDYAPSMVNIGSILNTQGDSESAMALYKRAIEKDETSYLAYYNMAVLCKQMGEYDAYMKYLKQYRRHYKRHLNDRERVHGKKAAMRLNLPIIAIIFLGITILVYIASANR